MSILKWMCLVYLCDVWIPVVCWLLFWDVDFMNDVLAMTSIFHIYLCNMDDTDSLCWVGACKLTVIILDTVLFIWTLCSFIFVLLIMYLTCYRILSYIYINNHLAFFFHTAECLVYSLTCILFRLFSHALRV